MLTGERSLLLRERVRLSLRLIAAVRAAGGTLFLSLWGVNLLRTVLPTATGLVTGMLVSRLITAPRDQGTLSELVMAGCGLMFLAQAVETLATALSFSASRRVDGWHRQCLIELMGRPDGIAHLEDPAVKDDLESALLKGLPGWASYTFGTGAVGQVVVTARTVGSCVAALVLAQFSWMLAMGLLLVTLAVRVGIRREWLAQHAVVRGLAPVTRQARYWADVVAMPWAAKELRIFGLTDWALGRSRDLMERRVARLAAVRVTVLRRMGWMFVPLSAGVLTGLGILASAAATGRISTGALAVYLGAFWGIVAANGMDIESFDVHFAGLPTLRALDRLQAQVGNGQMEERTEVHDWAEAPLVRFAAVEFAYPGTERKVLDGLDLEILPGEMLALVGVNGVGKTTLTKLLSGMYQPTAGRITVNGKALADIDLKRWWEQLTIVLQEFVRYDLSIRDNVLLGAPGRETDESLLDALAQQAGIDDLIAEAPLGWDTPLSRAYTGGTDLSGGQWQRIALARALFAVARGARLLVLDEPTAHLDVRAEADVFSRVALGARGCGIVLISHRLSTVRQADRIVLMDGGRVAESGSHDELIALGGKYAEMFALQADRFGTPLTENEVTAS